MARRATLQEVLDKFKEVHGNTYDYSLVDYQGDSKKVKIICKTHGEFEQQTASHIRQKQGCPKCGREKANMFIKEKSIGNEEFIKRIEKVFGKNIFDYSKLEYNGAHKDVTLICIKCGNTETKDPVSFYKGYGCLKCQYRRPNPKKITKDEFIKRSKEIHGLKYNYDLIEFIDLYNDVEIICPVHGPFFQKPTTHMHSRCNCPECGIYKGEEKIGIWLKDHHIKYDYQYKVRINNSNHYFDFYLPYYNMIIEFNGLQHYKPIKFFGGDEGFEKLKIRDKIKKEYCIDNKINLIIISYKDNIENILTNETKRFKKMG